MELQLCFPTVELLKRIRTKFKFINTNYVLTEQRVVLKQNKTKNKRQQIEGKINKKEKII